MNKIKKPKWDKPDCNTAISGGHGPQTTIPSNDHIDVGMTARAKHNFDYVIIKITNVENKCDAEGTIINIIPETQKKPKTDLLVGDRIFINLSNIESLSVN